MNEPDLRTRNEKYAETSDARRKRARLELLRAHTKAALVLFGIEEVVRLVQEIVDEHTKLMADEARRAELDADELDAKKFGPRP